eukprot:gnl/Dysnectes_brevis/555_a613_6249.p1 GENE.gnl/Dysnectes_brevis/555_a613_6249~~gnl/Dysnectes_brevis/555_a613_6249.p1  ORF type:complete len:202 (-),score=33.20 gnl/Dysnectes_brevis/555_a613_6249:32-613(-)
MDYQEDQDIGSHESAPIAKLWPVECWTKHDVSVWLSSIELKKYAQQFRRNDISGRSLMLLTEDNLKDDVGVESLGDRKALLYEIQRLDKWEGFLWRTDLAVGSDEEIVSLELLLSLAPNRMSALCSVRHTSLGNSEFPPVRVKWIFSQGQPDAQEDVVERFSTTANYDGRQCRSIIRLPCPVISAEAVIQPLQ